MLTIRPLLAAVGLALLLALLGLACAADAPAIPPPAQSSLPTALPTPTPTPAPTKTAAPASTAPTPTPPPAVIPTAAMTAADFPQPPPRDLPALARQLRWQGETPESRPRRFAGQPPAIGDTAEFWIADLWNLKILSQTFRLAVISDSAYWWVEDGLRINDDAMRQAADVAEGQVFPSIAAVFGPVLADGNASDSGPPPRLHVINGDIPGVGGYVSGSDAFGREVVPYSNEVDAIYINVRDVSVSDEVYLDVLAHELQHVIHERADASEDSWLNEGLSELAVTEAGFPSFSLYRFLQRPDISLVNWPPELSGDSGFSYGASSLFAHYLREHYAPGASLRDLLLEPADGIAGINAFLAAQGATAQSGAPATFHTVFADWIVANFLDWDNTRWGYDNLAPRAARIPGRLKPNDSPETVSLNQYGARYVRVAATSNPPEIHFTGTATAPLLPTELPGAACWWSNRGDSISATLSQSFALPHAGPDGASPTLSFQYWRHIEEDWDYAYLQASTDGGATWDVLPADGTTDYNPMGNSYGHGFTGYSDWQTIAVPLDAYAGRETILRFHYVTDDAIHAPGFCVRDLRIAGLTTGQNAGDTQWQPDGFVLVNNRVRQDWIVWLITDGEPPTATRMSLNYDPSTDMLYGSLKPPPGATGELTIAVSPAAPATTEPGQYRLWITE